LGLHDRFQTAIEKTFFKGKSSRKSVYLTFVIGNVVYAFAVLPGA